MAEAAGYFEDPEILVQRYLEDPRADLKDLILIHYAPLVERVARRFAGIEQQEDLLQVGYIGLLNALTKFDPRAGVRFNTYATYLVAGEIKHYLRDRSQTIRHPAWLQELRHRVNRAARALQHKLGREPSAEEIAEELGVNETAVREVFQTAEMLRVASLDAMPIDEEGDSEVERLDAADFCPEQIGVEDRLLLENAMKQLRDLERQVLIHFHFDSMNQTEIAAKLGISCNYVSHILRQSLGKLRKILASEEEKDRLLQRQAEAIEYDVLDATTGVYTETYFRARLEEELHRASGTSAVLALVLVKVDGLETLRSFYGQRSVDDFLLDAAEFLRGQVRRLDVVARYGEGGFGLLLPATGANGEVVLKRVLGRIERWMNTRFHAAGTVSIDIGYASYPQNGRTAAKLLESAGAKQAPKKKPRMKKAA